MVVLSERRSERGIDTKPIHVFYNHTSSTTPRLPTFLNSNEHNLLIYVRPSPSCPTIPARVSLAPHRLHTAAIPQCHTHRSLDILLNKVMALQDQHMVVDMGRHRHNKHPMITMWVSIDFSVHCTVLMYIFAEPTASTTRRLWLRTASAT